jgi:hypothetical protein
MARITVIRKGDSIYQVTVEEGSSRTRHSVTASSADVERYAPSGISPERLVEASFEFLLERESKESILTSFELPVIERYFPEYPQTIREKLRR